MTKNLPLVSVIIPTYNRAALVTTAIESVLNQTYPNIQLIVVDDGSEDHTAETMKKYPQAEYVIQSHGGQAKARNTGLAHAKGTVVASLDSDDVWYPGFLTACVNTLEDRQLDFVFTNWDQETREGTSWDFLARNPELNPYFTGDPEEWITLDNEDLRSVYIAACPSPSSAVVMRKSSMVRGWDQSMNIADDWMIYLDMIFTNKATAAFTLQKLWKKRVDDLNIYDGRKRNEVLRLLYIEDIQYIINHLKNQLTKEELKAFERQHMSALVELAKHHLIRDFKFLEAVKLLSRSFSYGKRYTLRKIPMVFLNGVQRRISSTAR